MLFFRKNPERHSPKRRCIQCQKNKYLTNTFYPRLNWQWQFSQLCRECGGTCRDKYQPMITEEAA